MADIQMRENQGERLEEIISRMGRAEEIADGFNENISPEEQRRYARNRVLKIVIPIALAVAFLGLLDIGCFLRLPISGGANILTGIR